MDSGVVNRAGPDGIPRAAIDDEVVAKRQDSAFVVKADLDIMDLVARMTRAHQVLATCLDPLYRSSQPARQEWNQQVFGVNVPFEAEAAADIKGHTAHARFRKP